MLQDGIHAFADPFGVRLLLPRAPDDARTVVNAVQVLARGWRDVAWRPLGLILLGTLPAVAAGYAVLDRLADWGDGLRILLGTVILVAALQLLLPGTRRTTPSPTFATLGYGIAGGGEALCLREGQRSSRIV